MPIVRLAPVVDVAAAAGFPGDGASCRTTSSSSYSLGASGSPASGTPTAFSMSDSAKPEAGTGVGARAASVEISSCHRAGQTLLNYLQPKH